MLSSRLALRGLGRNRRRVAITTAATAFAGFIMIVYSALFDGMLRTLERVVVAMEVGDLQIHAPGYRQDPDLYLRLEGGAELADRLAARGIAAAPRLYGYALAAAGNNSAGVEVRALDLDREERVTELHRHVLDGAWLDASAPSGVVIGRKLARSLNVEVGAELVLLGQAADGSTTNDLFVVRGILKNVGERTDRAGLLMVESSYRELFAVPEGHHELVLARGALPLEEAKAIASGIAVGASVETWREIQPSIARTLDVSGAALGILMSITYLAIAMVILNATLMSVFERIREFGVMKALGVTPTQVGLTVFFEVMLQAVIAAAAALAAGVPLALHLQATGLDLSKLAGSGGTMNVSGIAWDPVWYAMVTPQGVATPIAALFLMVALAAVYPGAKAALIRPLEAIAHR